jgi:transposase-like protein
MASRGVLVSYETVRRWCDKFGQKVPTGLKKRCREGRGLVP